MRKITKQQNKKTPKLRFPGFSGEWEEKRLGELAEIIMGQSPNSSSYNNKGIGKYLIQGNADILKRITCPRNWTSEPIKECKEGDLIMTVRAPVGYISKSLHNACIGRGVCAIRKKKNNSINFIYQFLLYFEKKWIKFEQGSTFTAVNTRDVKNLKINVPQKKEQQKIAGFLGGVDEWIENLKRQKEELEKYKKGIMQRIFPVKGKKVPQIRFKDDNGKDFPEWEEKRLGEVGEFLKGQGLSKDDIIADGKNECVLYGELYTTYDEVINIIKSKTDSNSEIKSNKGDVLIPSSTTTSHIDLANATAILKDGVLLGGDINILRNTKRFFDAIFLAYYLTNHKKHEIARLAQGTTIVHLYHSHLKKLKIKIPSLLEQQKIANFLSAIDEKIELVDTQIQKMQEWKRGLMQGLFV